MKKKRDLRVIANTYVTLTYAVKIFCNNDLKAVCSICIVGVIFYNNISG